MKSHRFSNILLAGAAILAFPEVSQAAFAGGIFKTATCDIIGYMAGSLGALLTGAAILTSVVAALMLNFRSFLGVVIVGVACFAMNDIMKVQFGDLCGAPTRQAGVITPGQEKRPGDAQLQQPDSSQDVIGFETGWGKL